MSAVELRGFGSQDCDRNPIQIISLLGIFAMGDLEQDPQISEKIRVRL
jgi:hypothetical protein